MILELHKDKLLSKLISIMQKGNAEGFMMDVATAGLTRGANQAIRWATTPVEIGRGAEAIVRSSPVSRLV